MLETALTLKVLSVVALVDSNFHFETFVLILGLSKTFMPDHLNDRMQGLAV